MNEGYNNEPNQYAPPADVPPIPNAYDNSGSNGYENNNIPNNNYGPPPPSANHPNEYYEEAQPNNEIYSAASTNSKTEKLPAEKK